MLDRRLQTAIVIAILAITAVAAVWSAVAQQAHTSTRLEAIATSEADSIQDALELLAGIGRAAGVALDREDRIDAAALDDVLDELGLIERFPAVVGIAYIERVDRDDLAGWVAAQRREDPGFELTVDAGSDVLLPVPYAYPEAVQASLVGIDLVALPAVAGAAVAALETREAHLSAATELISQADGRPGAVLAVPFIDRAGQARGVFGVGLSQATFIDAVLPLADRVRLTIRDPGNAEIPVVAEVGDEPVGGLVAARPIGLPTEAWVIEVRPTAGFVTAWARLAPWVLGASGLLVAAGAGVALGSLGSRERIASELADQRTVQLRQAVADLARANEELQRLNDQLRDADEMKDRFLASVSHELRTPLTVIAGFTETLQRLPIEDAASRDALLAPLERNVRRLDALVGDLLLLAGLDAGRQVPVARSVDLHATVERLAADLDLDRGGVVRNEVPPGFAITADERHLDHILVNLLGNARRHGGPPIVVTASQDDTHVRVVVRDHGPGLGGDDPARLLRRFERGSGAAHASGTGLGLAIVHELAILAGGQVHLSDADPGARIDVELPR